MPTPAFNATWQIFIVVNGQRLNNNQYRHLVTLLHSILNVGSPLHVTHSLTHQNDCEVCAEHAFVLLDSAAAAEEGDDDDEDGDDNQDDGRSGVDRD